jgi:nucleoside-diphosphate-sugar epimerase
MLTVGVTAVGGGVGQAVLSALRGGGLVTRVVGMDTRPLGPGLYWSDAAYLVPPVAEADAYLEQLLRICTTEQIDALIPGLDVEMPLLSRNAAPFAEIGCTIIVSSPQAVDLCTDKLALSRFCADNGFPFVPTYTVTEAQSRADILVFPVMIKPRRGAASAGARLASGDALVEMAPSNDLVVQDYLPPTSTIRLMAGAPTWGKELVQSEEISAQFFVGPSGAVIGNFVSINRLKHGVPLEIVPVDDAEIVEAGSRLVAAVSALGLRGPINLQGRRTNEGPVFFEANARFTGITGTRATLGYREVDAALECFVLGRPEDRITCLPSPSPRLAATRHVATTIVDTERTLGLMDPTVSLARHQARRPARLLVTGAAGYLGSNLIARLLETPDTEMLVATTHGEPSAAELASTLGKRKGLQIVAADLTADETWPLDGIDTVVHCAAARPGPPADHTPADFFLVNVEGTRRLLEQAGQAGIARLVFVSTQAVYGTSRPAPWSEADPPSPDGAYGLSKWLAEETLRVHHGPPEVVVLRLARLYGPGHAMRWDELPHRFAARTARGEPLPIYGSGNQRVDLLHIDDAAQGLQTACAAALPPQSRLIFNLGSDQPLSIRQLAATCRRTAVDLGLAEPPLRFVPDAIDEETDFLLDSRRARSHLGWKPQVPLEQAMRDLILLARDST